MSQSAFSLLSGLFWRFLPFTPKHQNPEKADFWEIELSFSLPCFLCCGWIFSRQFLEWKKYYLSIFGAFSHLWADIWHPKNWRFGGLWVFVRENTPKPQNIKNQQISRKKVGISQIWHRKWVFDEILTLNVVWNQDLLYLFSVKPF